MSYRFAARRVLQLEHRLRVEEVQFAIATPLVLAAGHQFALDQRRGRPGPRMVEQRLLARLPSMPMPPMRDGVLVK